MAMAPRVFGSRARQPRAKAIDGVDVVAVIETSHHGRLRYGEAGRVGESGREPVVRVSVERVRAREVPIGAELACQVQEEEPELRDDERGFRGRHGDVSRNQVEHDVAHDLGRERRLVRVAMQMSELEEKLDESNLAMCAALRRIGEAANRSRDVPELRQGRPGLELAIAEVQDQ